MSIRHWLLPLSFCVIGTVLLGLFFTSRLATNLYSDQLSHITYDRTGAPISVHTNVRGHYQLPTTAVPDEFTQFLITKEDQWFYWHPGINPIRTATALISYFHTGRSTGASTITQQLAKNILRNETDRTFGHKLQELWYSLAMELFWRKETILNYYMNTVYLGNQLQGFETASQGYFGVGLASSTPAMQLSLLATLSHPSTRNPWEPDNVSHAETLAATLLPHEAYTPPQPQSAFQMQQPAAFELTTAGVDCPQTCTTTIDAALTTNLRDILSRHVDAGRSRGIRSGAIVVLDAHTSEVLALIGTPDPTRSTAGNQINMAIEPRPIGSTVKPFIYATGFEMNLRPYTLVDDREYKYPIATGFSLYPKNYDGQYRGEVTLHEALSNSLNVPTVKTLEYIGLDTFYNLMEERLGFIPLQPWSEYQYGIALGGLEMDLLTLTHYFSLFPNHGTLAPLHIYTDHAINNIPPQATITDDREAFKPVYTELITAILSDRLTGVNQFGLKNNLSLPITNYAVKTGTSRDYHDSWVVGYTPDMVVGVWLGNTENEALQQVSGQTGAGAVWHDVMTYLINTSYYTDTPFTFSQISLAPMYDSQEWQVIGDTPDEHRSLLLGDELITNPHPNDTFEFFAGLTIPLHATAAATWRVNGTVIGTDTETTFSPQRSGTYEITAVNDNHSETITITITPPESL